MGPAFWWAIAAGVVIWFIRSRARAANAAVRRPGEPTRPTAPSKLAVSTNTVAARPPSLAPFPPPAAEPVRVTVRVAEPPVATYASTQIPAALRHANPVRWVGENDVVEAAGTAIRGGLFYFGSLASSSAFRNEPSVIDPALVVAGASSTAIWAATYWPSYSTCSPGDRRLLLRWLADGRKDPQASIGLVFIYFYGLERRLLDDARTLPDARAEVPRLIAEIDRLRRIYTNGSFQGYSASLRDLALAMYGDPSRFRGHGEGRPGEPTDGLLVALGRHLQSGQSLSSSLAYAWARSLEGAPRQSSVAAVSDELWRLFDIRYRKRYPDGLRVPRPKRNLTLDHHGAAFNRTRLSLSFDIPDVRAISAPQRPLAEVLDGCVQDLLPLAKTRKRDGVVPLELAVAMPAELNTSEDSNELAALRSFAEGVLGGSELAVADADDVLRVASIAGNEKITKRECTLIASAFQKLGLRIEPDVRWLGPKIERDRKVVIYRCGSDDAAQTPGPDYRLAQLFVQMTVSVASADGDIDELELKSAREHLEATAALSVGERKRLRAHLAWLATERSSIAKLLPQLKALPSEARRLVANAAIRVAAADGRVDPGEMKALEKIFRALGLDEGTIAAELHRMLTDPLSSVASTNDGRLNAAAIERKLKETADVQTLLASIFSENDVGFAGEKPPSEVVPPVEAQGVSNTVRAEASGVLGLDGAHTRLLRKILESAQDVIDRSSMDGWCRDLGLMTDGALESVNEAACTIAGDTLFDAEDAIVVHGDVRDLVKQAIEEVCA